MLLLLTAAATAAGQPGSGGPALERGRAVSEPDGPYGDEEGDAEGRDKDAAPRHRHRQAA